MTMLRVPLTETDRAALRAMGHDIPACTANACDQGRKPCPCPQDCRLPERDDSVSPVFEGLLSRWSLLSAVVTVGSIAAFVVWVTR